MKLCLPLKLRTALLACSSVAACTFTLSTGTLAVAAIGGMILASQSMAADKTIAVAADAAMTQTYATNITVDSGRTTLAYGNNGTSWNAVTNGKTLTLSGDILAGTDAASGILDLRANSNANQLTTFTIGGSSSAGIAKFNGKITLSNEIWGSVTLNLTGNKLSDATFDFSATNKSIVGNNIYTLNFTGNALLSGLHGGGDLQPGTTTCRVTAGTAAILTLGGAGTYNYRGIFGPDIGITMAGTGTQTFSGVIGTVTIAGSTSTPTAAPFTGKITANSGTLAFTNGLTSNGAIFRLGGGTLTVNTLTLNSNSTLELTSLSTTAPKATFGSLAMGTSLMIVDLGGIASQTDGTYNLFSVTDTAFAFNASLFGTKNIAAGKKAVFSFADGIVKMALANNSTHTWIGTGPLAWTTGATGWNGTEAFDAGDAVALQGTGTTNITITGSVAPSSISITSGIYNIATATGGNGITGGGTMTLNGDNVIVNLNSANTGYSGAINVSKGILNATVANALGTGTLTVSGGTANISNTQGLTGTTITGGEVVIKSTNAQAGLGTITGTAGNGALVIDWTTGNDTGTVGSAAPSANVAAYAGDIIIRSGRLAAGAALSASSISVTEGGQLYIGSGTWAQPITISGSGWTGSDVAKSGAIRFEGAILSGTLTVVGNSSIRLHSGTGTISGAIIGTGTLTKVGGGSLTLNDNSPGFTGTLDFTEGGTLTLAARGSGKSALNAGHIIMGANSKLIFDGNNGNFTSKSTGTVTLKSGVQVWATNPSGGAHSISMDFILDTGDGYANIGGFIFGNATLIYSTVSGTGNLSIKDEGTGSTYGNSFAFRNGWTTNSYRGLTLVRRSITFDANSVTNGLTLTPFGAYNADGTSGIATIQNGGTLTVSANSGTGAANTATLANGFILDGGNLTVNNFGAGVISGSITVSAAGVLASNSERLTLTGGLKGAEALTYNSGTAGARLILSGTDNSYTGTLTIGTAAGIQIDSAASGLSGMSIATSAGKSVFVGDDNGDISLDATVTGDGSISKSGTGTLVIASEHTSSFSGTTTVNDGKIQLGNGGTDGSLGTSTIALGDGHAMDINYAAGTTKQIANIITGSSGITLISGNASFTGDMSGYTGIVKASNGTNLALAGNTFNGKIRLEGSSMLNTSNMTWNTGADASLIYTTSSNTWTLADTTFSGTGKITIDVSGVTDYINEHEYVLAVWTGGTWTDANSAVIPAELGDFSYHVIRNGGTLSIRYALGANAYQWTGDTENATQGGAWGQGTAPTATDNVYLTETAFVSTSSTSLTVDTQTGLSVKSLNAAFGQAYTYTIAGTGFTSDTFVKGGAGTIILNGRNTFGSVTLNAGSTVIHDPLAFNPAAVDITMKDGAVLTYGASATGWTTDVISGSLKTAEGTDAAIDITADAGSVTWTQYAGAVNIVKSGTGTLQLNPVAVDAIATTITVNQGSLAIGSGTYAGTITMAAATNTLSITGDTTFGQSLTLTAPHGISLAGGTLTDMRTTIGNDIRLDGGSLHFGTNGTYGRQLTVGSDASALSTAGTTILAGTIVLEGTNTLNLDGGTFTWQTSANRVSLGDSTVLALTGDTSFLNLSMHAGSSLTGAHKITLAGGSLNGTVAADIVMTGGTDGSGNLSLNGINLSKLTVNGGGNLTGITGNIGVLDINLTHGRATDFGGMNGGKITSLQTSAGGARLTGVTGTIHVGTAAFNFGVDQAQPTGGNTPESVISGANLIVDGVLTANLSDELVAALKAQAGDTEFNVGLRVTDGTLTADAGKITYGNSMSLRIADTAISNGYINFSASLSNIFVASVDGAVTLPEAYTLSAYNALDAFEAVQMDHDLRISLPGTSPDTHPDGLVMQQVYGTGTASNGVTLTLDSSVEGENALVTLRNATADTTYLGSINAVNTDIVKDGAYALTVGGTFKVAADGSLTVREGAINLSGQHRKHSIDTLNIGQGSSLAVQGAKSQLAVNTLDLQGGTLSMSGSQSKLSVQGINDGTSGMIDLSNRSTLDIDLGTAPLGWYNGSIGSSDSTGTLNINTGTLAIGTSGRIDNVILNIADKSTLNLATGAEASVRQLQGGDLAVLQGGGSLTTSGTSSFKGDLSGFSGTLAVREGNLTITGMGNSRASIAAGENGTLTLDYRTWGASYASMNITGGIVNLLANNGSGTNNQLTLSGNSTVAHGTLALTLNTDPVQNLSAGYINMAGGAALGFGEGSVMRFSASSNSKLIQGTSPVEIVIVNGATTGSDNITVAYDQLFGKYFDAAGSRLEQRGNQLILVTAASRSPYYETIGLSHNAQAGGALLDRALRTVNPQAENPGSELAQAMNAIDSRISAGNRAGASQLMAAISGATVTTLNAAQLGTQERNMRAIRNRTVTMGIDPSVVQQDLPYWNAWASFNGANSDISQNGDQPGYKLSSWGGTIGADSDISRHITLGVAFTANYGKLTATG
ncbi:hypothetical protein AC781_05740, partial [Akkermansia glycaniphila]